MLQAEPKTFSKFLIKSREIAFEIIHIPAQNSSKLLCISSIQELEPDIVQVPPVFQDRLVFPSVARVPSSVSHVHFSVNEGSDKQIQ